MTRGEMMLVDRWRDAMVDQCQLRLKVWGRKGVETVWGNRLFMHCDVLGAPKTVSWRKMCISISDVTHMYASKKCKIYHRQRIWMKRENQTFWPITPLWDWLSSWICLKLVDVCHGGTVWISSGLKKGIGGIVIPLTPEMWSSPGTWRNDDDKARRAKGYELLNAAVAGYISVWWALSSTIFSSRTRI